MSDPMSLLAEPIITKVIELAYAFSKNKYDKLYGVEGEIEKLTSNLSSIAAVLKDAEHCCSDSKSEQLVDWLTKLRDAALDAEDILETYAAEVAMREKQRYPALLAWISSRSEAANKIKKIVARINIISQEKNNFHFRPKDYGGTDWTPQPTRFGMGEIDCLRDTSDIVGREEEKNEVVRWLLSEEESDNNRYSVLPIIGMGGLGKTTLAQLVYNDARVYKKQDEACHFKVAMWINVSVDSSVDRILREMVDILTEMTHGKVPQSSIKNQILEVLDGKHFLLVLDDVWVEKLDWEPLHNFFRECPKGSKVLVTSRNGNVARIMGAAHTHTLGHLPEERCWDLFVKRAFPPNGVYSKDLEEIGRKIVHRCNCLPLAVKAMAGLLRGKNDVSQWQRILRNGIWESEQYSLGNGAPNILPALKLSYDYLPSQLKQCFAYCYIFPKGHMFDKNDLVKLWIAEGYIQLRGENKLEETGSDYFNELLARSFFQILDIDSQVQYKMHDLIHDLAKSVSSCCQHVEENKPCSIEHTLRHVSFNCKDVQKPAQEILKAEKLRTLLLPISYPRDFGHTLDNMFHALKYMRVLDLSSSSIIDLPKSIGKLKLLRYLDLSRTEIRLLPNTICNLSNLQTLKLLECLWLLELPKDLGNLKNLRYLELDEMFWYKCSTLPPSIGGITNLHNLHTFHVRQESGYGIEELKSMNSLEGTLHISKLENSTDAKAAELKQKLGITKLILEWSKEVAHSQHRTVQDTVLEDLEPYKSLQELHIHHYKGSRLSSWMGNGVLVNLHKISLNHCVSCRILSLGPLQHLQELCIKGMLELAEWSEAQYPSLTRVTISKCPQLRELPSIFPNLTVMKIKHCDALKALPVMPIVTFLILSNNALLEEWGEATMPIDIVIRNHDGQDEHIHIQWHLFTVLLELSIINCPRLQGMPQNFSPQKLQISGCPLLRTLPQLNQRLQCLEIDNCNGSSLVEAIQSTGSLYSLIISNITNLASLPKLPHLPQLKSLYIYNCQDLVCLSREDSSLQNLTSLKFLSVSGCQKLVLFSEEGLPTSLECLSIENCFKLQSFPTRNYLASLTSLKDLYLENCPKLESLPEDGLPISLQHLRIQGCSPLTQQCNKEVGGKYWQMISHVADLELDSSMNHEPKPSLGPSKGYLTCFTGK